MHVSRLVAGAAAGLALLAPTVAHGQSEPSPPEIMFLHAIPGVDMDIFVDGEVLIPDFAPGDMQDLSAFAGETLTDIEVRVAETGEVAFGPVPEFEVPASGSWTVVAHLDEEKTPVITPYENGDAATPDGEGRLTLRHVAAAPPVDLVIGGGTEVRGAANGSTEHVVLVAGEIADAALVDGGGDELAALPVLDIGAGQNLVVHVARSPLDDTFAFYVQERQVGSIAPAQAEDIAGDADPARGDGTPAPTSVQTGDELRTGGPDAMWLLAAGFAAIAAAAAAVAAGRERPSL